MASAMSDLCTVGPNGRAVLRRDIFPAVKIFAGIRCRATVQVHPCAQAWQRKSLGGGAELIVGADIAGNVQTSSWWRLKPIDQIMKSMRNYIHNWDVERSMELTRDRKIYLHTRGLRRRNRQGKEI